MPNLISYSERKIKAKGARKEYQLNQEVLQNHFFDEDYENLKLLRSIQKMNHSGKKTLFYPGCGVDILFPLHYVEILFPKVDKFLFIFCDIDNTLGTIETILDDIGVPFSKSKQQIEFYWKEKKINLQFIEGNVFSIDLPSFDIYFEKAFRIMKDADESYESRVINQLHKNGVLISDSGYLEQQLERIKVSLELSSYQEMIIGIKKNKKK